MKKLCLVLTLVFVLMLTSCSLGKDTPTKTPSNDKEVVSQEKEEMLYEYVLYYPDSQAQTLNPVVKKAIKAVIKPLEDKIDAYGSDNAKNYLVPFLSKVVRGEPIDEIELERFHEEYEFYLKHGGNSYVKSRVDKLIKEGKL